jgi:iron complex transport system substrate-binding protein
LGIVALLLSASAQAAISVTDDLGHTVSLAKPAQRVISLSPHVTELIFAAGAGDKIIGTVKYSDYPAAAKDIPRIGDNRQFDLERIIAMKPDLLVIWMHGAFERQLEVLKQSGVPFFQRSAKAGTDSRHHPQTREFAWYRKSSTTFRQ